MTDLKASMTARLQVRLAAIFLMGFASGLPRALSASTLAIRLSDYGVSLKSIGLFALVGSAYSLKFLWSPAIDGVPIPLLTRLVGQRRSWVLVTQAGLVVALIGLGCSDPGIDLRQTAVWALVLAVCSATQDIAVDGLRVDILSVDEQGAGASATQLGYRLGMIVSTAGALIFATRQGWAATYVLMAALVGFGAAGCLMVAERPGTAIPPRDFLRRRIAEPLADFLRRDGAVLILLFVPLYFLGDAVAGGLSGPFYLSLGFTKDEIAKISKFLGVIASVAGVGIGGVVVQRLGVGRALLLCGVAKMATSLLYIVQFRAGHDTMALAFTISGENLAGGAAGSAFVAYLSSLCSRRHSATQYALLSAIATLGTNVVAASSGYLQADLGWQGFFLFSTGLAFPALLLLTVLRHKLVAVQKEPDCEPEIEDPSSAMRGR